MAKSGRCSNRVSRVRRSLPEALLAVVLLMPMEGSFAGSRPSGSLVPTRSEVIATQGMAATSHPLHDGANTRDPCIPAASIANRL